MKKNKDTEAFSRLERDMCEARGASAFASWLIVIASVLSGGIFIYGMMTGSF